MTKAQALKEAHRRWGKRGDVWHTRGWKCKLRVTPYGNSRYGPMLPWCPTHGRGCPGDQPIYEVGEYYTISGMGTGRVIHGIGSSWADAFTKVS